MLRPRGHRPRTTSHPRPLVHVIHAASPHLLSLPCPARWWRKQETIAGAERGGGARVWRRVEGRQLVFLARRDADLSRFLAMACNLQRWWPPLFFPDLAPAALRGYLLLSGCQPSPRFHSMLLESAPSLSPALSDSEPLSLSRSGGCRGGKVSWLVACHQSHVPRHCVKTLGKTAGPSPMLCLCDCPSRHGSIIPWPASCCCVLCIFVVVSCLAWFSSQPGCSWEPALSANAKFIPSPAVRLGRASKQNRSDIHLIFLSVCVCVRTHIYHPAPMNDWGHDHHPPASWLAAAMVRCP